MKTTVLKIVDSDKKTSKTPDQWAKQIKWGAIRVNGMWYAVVDKSIQFEWPYQFSTGACDDARRTASFAGKNPANEPQHV